jgi:hypothetical protein
LGAGSSTLVRVGQGADGAGEDGLARLAVAPPGCCIKLEDPLAGLVLGHALTSVHCCSQFLHQSTGDFDVAFAVRLVGLLLVVVLPDRET